MKISNAGNVKGTHRIKYHTEYFNSYKINNTLSLQGHSRAGMQTSFLLNPYNVLFDFGLYTNKNINIGFMTHQHIDHSQKIPAIYSKNRTQKKKLYLPSSSKKHVIKHQRSIIELDNPELEFITDEEFVEEISTEYCQLEPGNIILEEDLNNGTLNTHIPYQIEILKAYHNVDSIGYGFTENKKVLKKEIKDMLTNDNKANGILMKSLKKSGELYETIQIPTFAFYCDSQIYNLSNHEEWKKYPVIICECTGLNAPESDEEKYLSRYHTCITQLLPIMREHITKRWILIHVSMSLTVSEIIEIEKKLIEDGFNVSIVYDNR